MGWFGKRREVILGGKKLEWKFLNIVYFFSLDFFALDFRFWLLLIFHFRYSYVSQKNHLAITMFRCDHEVDARDSFFL